MSRTILDSRQTEHRETLENIGTPANATLKTILESINAHLGQLKITPDSPISQRVIIPGSDVLKDLGYNLNLVSNNTLISFAGAQIDFETGEIFKDDGTTLVSTFTPFVLAADEYFYYSITASLDSVLNADNTSNLILTVTPAASADLVLADAPKAFFVDGLPLGQVYVRKDETNTSILNIDWANIIQIAAGSGGGGSGTGDMTQFQSSLANRLDSSFYQHVTPNEFSIDKATLISSATATFDIVDGVYSFTAASENIISAQMFNEQFLESDDDSLQLELHADWFDSASRDNAAVYEASLNGVDYEVITMTRQGLSERFTGSKKLAVPANAIISTQASTDGTTELNATTIQSFSAPVVLADKHAASSLVLELNKLGSPVGSYIISIREDNAGVPGDVLFSTIALVSTLSAGTNVITLNNFRNVLPVGTYHIEIQTDATYKSGFSAGVNSVRLNTQSGGNDLVFNGTSWSVGTTDLKYTLSGHIYDLRVRIASSAGNKKLKAYGIFYDEHVGSITEGVEALQKFRFSGDANTNSFLITRFLPNPNHMKVYDIRTGQVYRNPAFEISGHTVNFPVNTFLVPGETIELIFDQSQGTGFDQSEPNANLLANNHLGSTDATTDKSVSGRGILLRNSNGELKELWLDASNNLNITNPL